MKLKKYKYEIIIAVITAIMMLVMDNTSPLYKLTTYCDLSIFYNIGRRIADGQVLFRDVFDFKGQLTFFIGAISYKLFGVTLLYFIIDLVSFSIWSVVNYKIYNKIIRNNKTALILAISNFSILYYVTMLGNAEGWIIGAFSYLIYLMLFVDMKNKLHKEAMIISAISWFIFYTKINYIIPISVIIITYIIYCIKNKMASNLVKNSIIGIAVFTVLSLPFIVYEVVNGESPMFLTKTYLELVANYKNDFKTQDVLLNNYRVIIFITGIVLITFMCYIITLYTNVNIYKIIRLAVMMLITITFLSKTILYNHLYIMISLSWLIYLSIYFLIKKWFIIINVPILIGVIVLHCYVNIENKDNNIKAFANKYGAELAGKDVFVPNSINVASIESYLPITTFDNFSAMYSSYRGLDILDKFRERVKNCEPEYLILTDKGDIGSVEKTFNLGIDDINKNYEIISKHNKIKIQLSNLSSILKCAKIVYIGENEFNLVLLRRRK